MIRQSGFFFNLMAATTGRRLTSSLTSTLTSSLTSTAAVSGKGWKGRSMERRGLRHAFPEFLPDPNPLHRNRLREMLERQDMLKRRRQVEIPEFYVGSVLAVTASDPNSTPASAAAATAAAEGGKQMRFVGIVVDRGGTGLRAWTVVRNVIDGQGVEILYSLYSPNIVRVEVLRLERRLDNELYYLRDALPEYSTVPVDMEQELLADGETVPLNDTVVKMKPKPWTRKWERYRDILKGLDLDPEWCQFSQKDLKALEVFDATMNPGWQLKVVKYDLMRHYRNTIAVEEQDAIWEEVGDELEARDEEVKRLAIRRQLMRSTTTTK